MFKVMDKKMITNPSRKVCLSSPINILLNLTINKKKIPSHSEIIGYVVGRFTFEWIHNTKGQIYFYKRADV